MAQVSYKYKKVQNGRHIVRGLISASLPVIDALRTDGMVEDQIEDMRVVRSLLSEAVSKISGREGYSKEQQVERLEVARANVVSALRTVAKVRGADKTQTSHQNNLWEDLDNLLATARNHLTATRQFAKDRKVETVDDVIADFAVYAVE